MSCLLLKLCREKESLLLALSVTLYRSVPKFFHLQGTCRKYGTSMSKSESVITNRSLIPSGVWSPVSEVSLALPGPVGWPTLPLRILGVDPSLTNTAVVWPDKSGVCIHPPDGLVGAGRLYYLSQAFRHIVGSFRPHMVMLEGYSFGSVGRLADLGEWGGLIRTILYEHQALYTVVPPIKLKEYILGKTKRGDGKTVMVSALSAMTGQRFRHDDEADAYALVALGQAWYNKDHWLPECKGNLASVADGITWAYRNAAGVPFTEIAKTTKLKQEKKARVRARKKEATI